MNKKALGLFLATTVLATLPMNFNPSLAQGTSPDANKDEVYLLATKMEDLIDVPPNHWAYNAVKVLVEELDIMMPKTSNMFKGQDLMTRNELAQVFYRAVKKMESISGKNLKQLSNVPKIDMVDVDAANASYVNSVVNEYGIMQPMPGKRFMGSEPISRYEIAFELYNYFVLVESQGTKPVLSRRDLARQLSDLPADHWATKAVNEIVDKYQIMDGYPDKTFRGGRRLTRYETAAVVREFIRYVDTYLLPLTGGTPTPKPTPLPTPKPTPIPTPKPTPIPAATKVPFKPVDLRIGGDFKVSYTDNTNSKVGYIYGPNASLDWYFLPIGPTRLGIDLHVDDMFYDPLIAPGQFKADQVDANGQPFQTTLTSRLTAGGGLIWRLLGAQSAEDLGLSVGVGYDYLKLDGVGYSYSNHGPRGRVDLEIPIGSAFSIVARDSFTYFIGPAAGVPDNMQWKNDAFLGVTIPAYTNFAVEVGYKDTRYMQTGDSALYGDIGGQLNLRFRF